MTELSLQSIGTWYINIADDEPFNDFFFHVIYRYVSSWVYWIFVCGLTHTSSLYYHVEIK